MPPSNFRRPRAVRDSSRFLSLSVVVVAAEEEAVAETTAEAAAGRRVRWSSLFGAGDSLGREVEVEEVEVVDEVLGVPVRPAALRVP
jgi:acyl dehydratase